MSKKVELLIEKLLENYGSGEVAISHPEIRSRITIRYRMEAGIPYLLIAPLSGLYRRAYLYDALVDLVYKFTKRKGYNLVRAPRDVIELKGTALTTDNTAKNDAVELAHLISIDPLSTT